MLGKPVKNVIPSYIFFFLSLLSQGTRILLIYALTKFSSLLSLSLALWNAPRRYSLKVFFFWLIFMAQIGRARISWTAGRKMLLCHLPVLLLHKLSSLVSVVALILEPFQSELGHKGGWHPTLAASILPSDPIRGQGRGSPGLNLQCSNGYCPFCPLGCATASLLFQHWISQWLWGVNRCPLRLG